MIILFYGTQEYHRYATFKEMSKDIYPHTQVQADVYNGGYAFNQADQKWYRCDLTPVLLEDVPKILQMLALVLNM